MNARAAYLRSFLAALIAIAFVESAFAQGTINFANLVIVDGVHVEDAPVRYYDGTLLSGNAFMAQLYVGTSRQSLNPVSAPTPFLSSPQAGYFSAGTQMIDWVLPGGTIAIVEVRVWEVASGPTWDTATRRAASNGMTIQTGGLSGAPPANLIGLQPFSFMPIPEPPTLAILFFGAVIVRVRSWPRHR
jgi:hypothetical protein